MIILGKFTNKVVIITGGGQGIGLGIATAFAKEGANIVITGRTEAKLVKAKGELEEAYGISVLAITADNGDEAAVKKVIESTVKEFGQIDVLINNAQVSKSGVLLVDHSKEDFDVAIMSGLYGTFFYMKAAFPYLKDSKGSVINFASAAGLFGREGQSSYAAAKEGIRGMSRVAATEWAKFGININVVCPLAMSEGLEKWKAQYPELYAETIKTIPMGRFADTEKDIGRVCIFLASEDAKFITGETITIQGGSGLRP